MSRQALGAVLLAAAAGACAAGPAPDPASSLRSRFAAMAAVLEAGPIQRGLHVESVDSSRAPRGDAYAVMHFPFATVASAFATPAVLCESLILHLNIHHCRASDDETSPALSLALGKKTRQPLEDTYRIEFAFHLETSGDEYLRLELSAADGPLDSADYLIALELVALDAQRSFMHIAYAYRQGVMARFATSLYFATQGREKVGFSPVSDSAGDAPQLVRGIRGVLERNTMRYYLAFNAYLHSLAVPQALRFEASLERWFADTERFARQLREVGRAEYLAMKRAQYARQLAAR